MRGGVVFLALRACKLKNVRVRVKVRVSFFFEELW